MDLFLRKDSDMLSMYRAKYLGYYKCLIDLTFKEICKVSYLPSTLKSLYCVFTWEPQLKCKFKGKAYYLYMFEST